MPDMGSGEVGTPTKTTKTSTPQEQTPTTTSAMPYPEWAAAFQAYYSTGMSPLPPPGYFPSTMASGPQPHPYMWGAQPLMPPYGTPPPYATMYPHGGIYAHPPMTPVSASIGTDAEGKSTDGNTKKTGKRSKGSLGNLGLLTAKATDTGKTNAESMNGVLSHSGDSGSEGSTDASEGNSQDEVRKSSFDQATSEAPNSHVVVGAGPLTNLNIGMDYWSGGTHGVLAAGQGKRGSAGANTTALIPSSSVVPGELWIQDERELKRQRRKQSNRESARRSRLRKQAECEELATRVERLRSENASLREELNRMTEECKKLSAENSSLMDQLHLPRSEGLNGDLEKMNTNLAKQEVLGEGMQLDQDSL